VTHILSPISKTTAPGTKQERERNRSLAAATYDFRIVITVCGGGFDSLFRSFASALSDSLRCQVIQVTFAVFFPKKAEREE
jgi:hypothetical protein